MTRIIIVCGMSFLGQFRAREIHTYHIIYGKEGPRSIHSTYICRLDSHISLRHMKARERDDPSKTVALANQANKAPPMAYLSGCVTFQDLLHHSICLKGRLQ